MLICQNCGYVEKEAANPRFCRMCGRAFPINDNTDEEKKLSAFMEDVLIRIEEINGGQLPIWYTGKVHQIWVISGNGYVSSCAKYGNGSKTEVKHAQLPQRELNKLRRLCDKSWEFPTDERAFAFDGINYKIQIYDTSGKVKYSFYGRPCDKTLETVRKIVCDIPETYFPSHEWGELSSEMQELARRVLFTGEEKGK